jgi:AraC-like DNA-binding protein
MERAKEHLEFSFMSVKQIMVSIGVRDRSHFEREFKKAYGLTPTQYRASIKLVLSAR